MRSELGEAADKPLDTPLWAPTDGELLADLDELLLVRDRVEARLAATVAEASHRGLDNLGNWGPDAGQLVRDRAKARIGKRETKRIVRRLATRASLPLVAALHDAGIVSTAFVDAAGDGLHTLPPEAVSALDALLSSEPARECDPDDLPTLLAQVRATVDPDGDVDRAAGRDSSNRVFINPVGTEGAYALDGTLHSIEGERVRAMLKNRARILLKRGDFRGPAERRATALFEIFGIAERATDDDDHLKAPHGADVHVTVFANAATWRGEPGAPAARTSAGHVVDNAQLARLRCNTPNPDVLVADAVGPRAQPPAESITDADLLSRSLAGLVAHPAAYRLVPLVYGRGTRTITKAQWTVLVARDRHCVYPRCSSPPDDCEAHHIREYDADQGASDIDNYALLCKRDHLRLHRANSHLHPPWCLCHPDHDRWTIQWGPAELS